LGRRR
jgi:hypothetical protein